MSQTGAEGGTRRDSLRILMVSDLYPPVIGGLERCVQALARELAERGHSVSVATLETGNAPVRAREGPLKIYRLRGWQRVLGPWYEQSDRPFHPTMPDPGIVAGLRRVMMEEQSEILHLHSWILYSALPLAWRRRVGVVMTLHDYGLVCPKKTYLYGDTPCSGPALTKCIPCAGRHYGAVKGAGLTLALHASTPMHRQVDRFLAISPAVRDASLAAARDVPVDVVPSFISDRAAAEAAPERPAFLPPLDNYLLFVGALGKHKGLHVLLEAYQRLERQIPLVLLGTEQPDTPRHFPPGVIVVRDVPHEQVMAAWARCLLGVVPSVWEEPFGQVAVEAMASGKPVVASRVGGLRSIVADGDTGLLIPPGDAVSLADALRTLVDDPARCARMGELARNRARLFTVSVVTDRIEQVYHAVRAERTAARDRAEATGRNSS